METKYVTWEKTDEDKFYLVINDENYGYLEERDNKFYFSVSYLDEKELIANSIDNAMKESYEVVKKSIKRKIEELEQAIVLMDLDIDDSHLGG